MMHQNNFKIIFKIIVNKKGNININKIKNRLN